MPEPEVQFTRRLSRRDPRAIALIAGACLAIVVGTAVTLGASPSASPSMPGGSEQPQASSDPTAPDWEAKVRLGRGPFDGRGRFGGVGTGGVTIASIDGDEVDLETADGWTRTIDVSTTTITKDGQPIEVDELAVGDRIAFRQTRNADGTFTVTAIHVLRPSVFGTVRAVSGTTITITDRDGSTQTIHVDAATTYRVEGADAGFGDIAVGMRLIAVGSLNADGSLDAAAIRAGTERIRRGPGEHPKPGMPGPSTSPESSQGTG